LISCKSYLRSSAFICVLCLFDLASKATIAAQIDTDICVLSATPAGISAAVAASRLGSKVVLIERTSHIGGLPANGLGVTDIATRATIGGLFKEFVTAVKQHYEKTYGADSQQVKDCSDGYHFEPHVAEQVFERLLSNAANVHVLRRHQFDGQAEVENQKLKSIMITNRDTEEKSQIKAKAFIDATYEGDLAAAAGVPYRIGREGRDETLEPYAGVFYSYFGTKEIYDDLHTGQGDHRIQAYNYRLCLTDRPDLRVLPSKPSTYHRDDYASLVEDIQKQWVTAFGATPGNTSGIFNIVRVPNGKSDTNNHHNSLVSTDLPEENQPWPEAKWDWRDQFEKRLKDYTLGLLWFAQNDDGLPRWFREQARQWGLAKDEYQDNGNFPRQAYVREGRRIRGEYDFSAHDAIVAPGATRTPIHPNSITAAHYAIDSHALRKREAGKRALDGFLGLGHITRPYTVPYGVMLPEKIDGLLVPVAVSATHLGFGTLRMEPCWMAMGQASGTAAHLAWKSGQEVRQVSITKLQRHLLDQGQVLVCYRDLSPDHPSFKAMQYFGVRGFFPLWEAEPHQPVLRGEAISWFEKLELKIWDRSRPLETLEWNVLERWLDRKLGRGQHPYVSRHEMASVLFEGVDE
jgi:FAD-dependent oxidoreductase family protein